MATKIGFITDLHLKEREKSFMKEKRQELLKKFANESIKAFNINHLVYGGDIFDGIGVETSSEIAKFFFNDIVGNISKNYNIQQDFIVGNHEKRGKRNVYDIMNKNILSPNIAIRDVIEGKEYSDFNAIYIPYLYISDYSSNNNKIEAEKNVFEQIKKISDSMKLKNGKPVIVFNHNIMGGVWFETEKEINIDLSNIDSIDFVLGGHIHKKIELKKGLYVGSFMRSFTYEEENEGFYILTIDNGKISGEYIPLKSFDYKKVLIESDKINNFTWEKDNVYSLEFVFKNKNKDNFIVSNTLKSIKQAGGYIKDFKIKKLEDVKNMEKVISISNSKEEILKMYLNRDKKFSKEEQNELFEKLLECSEKTNIKNNENLLKEKKHIEKLKNKEKKNVMIEKITNITNNLIQNELAF